MKNIGFSVILFLVSLPLQAGGWPTKKQLERDLQVFWKKNRPQEKLALIRGESECSPLAIEQLPTVGGKKARGKACVVSVDLYLEQGFRFQVWRESKVYYVNRSLWWVETGRLDWAWREGGVPPPTPEQAISLIKEALKKELGSESIELSLVEMGQPHSQGENYRLTLVVNLRSADGELKDFPIFLFSDGGDWRLAEGINRLPPQR